MIGNPNFFVFDFLQEKKNAKLWSILGFRPLKYGKGLT